MTPSRVARLRVGLSYRGAAKKAGVAMSTIYRLENGGSLGSDVLSRIADAYGVTMDQLAGRIPLFPSPDGEVVA